MWWAAIILGVSIVVHFCTWSLLRAAARADRWREHEEEQDD